LVVARTLVADGEGSTVEGEHVEVEHVEVEPVDVEDFCRQVSPKLVGALLLQCGDQEVAEDLAQESLARAWERWDQVSAMARPEGWVFRVAFNLASSRRRRAEAARRAHARLQTRREPEAAGPDEVAIKASRGQGRRERSDRRRP
jgi:RNA polymerase sigma-70 factor (ECF subfamily)